MNTFNIETRNRGTVLTCPRPNEARLVLASVDALAAALAASFHDLTPKAQARALELEIALSGVRKQLI